MIATALYLLASLFGLAPFSFAGLFVAFFIDVVVGAVLEALPRPR